MMMIPFRLLKHSVGGGVPTADGDTTTDATRVRKHTVDYCSREYVVTQRNENNAKEYRHWNAP